MSIQKMIQRGLVVADKEESGLTPYISRTSTVNPRCSHKISRRPHLLSSCWHRAASAMGEDRNKCEWGVIALAQSAYGTVLSNDASAMEAYCGLDMHNIYAYPEWDKMPAPIWFSIGLSAALSLFLQWSTTAAAIIITYLNPTKGLSCRSVEYLLCGTNATLMPRSRGSCWLLDPVSPMVQCSDMNGRSKVDSKHRCDRLCIR